MFTQCLHTHSFNSNLFHIYTIHIHLFLSIPAHLTLTQCLHIPSFQSCVTHFIFYNTYTYLPFNSSACHILSLLSIPVHFILHNAYIPLPFNCSQFHAYTMPTHHFTFNYSSPYHIYAMSTLLFLSILVHSIKQMSMIWKCPITYHRPTHGTIRRRHRTLTATQQQGQNKSKAICFLFLSEMIAKLGRTHNYCITKQGPNIEIPTNSRSSNNNESTTAEPPS